MSDKQKTTSSDHLTDEILLNDPQREWVIKPVISIKFEVELLVSGLEQVSDVHNVKSVPPAICARANAGVEMCIYHLHSGTEMHSTSKIWLMEQVVYFATHVPSRLGDAETILRNLYLEIPEDLQDLVRQMIDEIISTRARYETQCGEQLHPGRATQK